MPVKNPQYRNIRQSLLFIFVCLWGAYILHLTWTETENKYIVDTLRSWHLIFIPSFVIEKIKYEGNFGILILMALSALHTLVYSYLVYYIILSIGKFALLRNGLNAQQELDSKGPSLSENLKTSYKMVRPLLNGQTKGEVVDLDYTMNFYELGHALVELKREPITAIERLQKSILEVLRYHKDWPACIDGHHSDQNLQNHSLDVASRTELESRSRSGGTADPMALVTGLAHDLDKIVGYQKTESGWKKKATNFRHIGRHLLSNLDGYDDLSSDDRRAINYAIRYSHEPEKIPVDATEREISLLESLRKADGLATRDDQTLLASHTELGIESGGDVAVMVTALWQVIDDININQYKGGKTYEGWYKAGESWWAATNTSLLDALEEKLEQDFKRKYQIGVNHKNGEHQANSLILEALKDMGLALTEVSGSESNSCLYLMRAGRFKFTNVRIMSAGRVREYSSKLLDSWGDSDFPLSVQGSSQ